MTKRILNSLILLLTFYSLLNANNFKEQKKYPSLGFGVHSSFEQLVGYGAVIRTDFKNLNIVSYFSYAADDLDSTELDSEYDYEINDSLKYIGKEDEFLHINSEITYTHRFNDLISLAPAFNIDFMKFEFLDNAISKNSGITYKGKNLWRSEKYNSKFKYGYEFRPGISLKLIIKDGWYYKFRYNMLSECPFEQIFGYALQGRRCFGYMDLSMKSSEFSSREYLGTAMAFRVGAGYFLCKNYHASNKLNNKNLDVQYLLKPAIPSIGTGIFIGLAMVVYRSLLR